jgi:histone H1/5
MAEVIGIATSPVSGGGSGTIGVSVSSSEKKVIKKSKKVSRTPSHPPTQQMVDASIKNLKERGGSSLLAIKKYISSTYKCDAQKLAPFIKKYLKSAVASGKLIQTKGKGASGSFKLSPAVNKTNKSIEIEKIKNISNQNKRALTKKITSQDKKQKKPKTIKKVIEKKIVMKNKKLVKTDKKSDEKFSKIKSAVPSKSKLTKPTKIASAKKSLTSQKRPVKKLIKKMK